MQILRQISSFRKPKESEESLSLHVADRDARPCVFYMIQNLKFR
jgi:hypothetical protein